MSDVRTFENAPPSEEELAARARSGDRGAFEALYSRHGRRLATLLAVRFPGRQDDLLQEAFLRAWCKMDQFRGGNFAAWVYRIAQNVAADESRKPACQPPPDQGRRATGSDQEPPEIVMRAEREAKLRRCLGKLEEAARALIESKYGGAEGHAAVCRRLGVTEQRGYKVRCRALKQLRSCMERGS